MVFSLFDAAGSGSPPSGGNQIGGNQSMPNTTVSGGQFTVTLNDAGQFGANAFNGEARWLQIAVRSPAGGGGFTTLAPRQAITATPYALGPWQHSNGFLSYTGGSVGIGTTAPTAKLDVHGPVVIVSEGDQAEALWLGIERSWLFGQEGTGAGTALKLESVGGGGNKNFLIQTTGNVGIGTSTPASKLDVHGDIRLGTTGELLAPGSQENLRIIRGVVSPTGTIVDGSGFTVTRDDVGTYTINFNTPFSNFPTLTGNAHYSFASGSYRFLMVEIRSLFYVKVRVGTAGGFQDGQFSFIAVGPR
jgi:hypothetical protein